MTTQVSDFLSPLIWWGLDLLWLLIGILLVVKIKAKAALIFLIASIFSFLISTVNMVNTFSYNWSAGFINYQDNWHLLVFDSGWASCYIVMIISLAVILFRAGAALKRNRELEAILADKLQPKPHSQD